MGVPVDQLDTVSKGHGKKPENISTLLLFARIRGRGTHLGEPDGFVTDVMLLHEGLNFVNMSLELFPAAGLSAQFCARIFTIMLPRKPQNAITIPIRTVTRMTVPRRGDPMK